MLTESQKKSRNKWDAANMTVLGCKVRRDKAEQFKVACKKNGTSPNAIFIAAMEKFMEEHGEVGENPKP
ncbi:hypothetical protein D1646_06855 [Pseudoflavonifractor sp. 60]|uniref:hypothetical protein n=1 Tax=Pseudoflavonifractor sp. 60 TaxID=2304576 RepID=UPI00136D93FE|nr:hypothetical protein [Pseudoflavonifractor sp. 60]NBI66540.1 hypothetical protein [Pseudoflavonifractor sp. 60]